MQFRGFIALMSAIIISAVLLIIVTTSSFTGFFGRTNILDAELKARSAAAAEACINSQILAIASNLVLCPTITDIDLNTIDHCTIKFLTCSPIEIKAQGTANGAYTNLDVLVDPADFSITSWKEIITLP